MSQLAATEVLGTATQLLARGGFATGPEASLATGDILRVFEDSLSIVGLVYFDSWDALSSRWVDAQVALVELLTERLAPNDPKAWEGYLLLFTLDAAPDALAIDAVRRDTTRLRKIVTTGTELKTLAQVEQALLPVLPLRPAHVASAREAVLGRLPDLLADDDGPPRELTTRIVEAFNNNELIMEAIWEWRRQQ